MKKKLPIIVDEEMKVLIREGDTSNCSIRRAGVEICSSKMR